VTYSEPARRPPRDARTRGRARAVRALLVLAGAVLLFGIGVAVGEALHDNPSPRGRQTYTATIVVSK
jgi:hypothetical protein